MKAVIVRVAKDIARQDGSTDPLRSATPRC